jgi:hypothetical protein
MVKQKKSTGIINIIYHLTKVISTGNWLLYPPDDPLCSSTLVKIISLWSPISFAFHVFLFLDHINKVKPTLFKTSFRFIAHRQLFIPRSKRFIKQTLGVKLSLCFSCFFMSSVFVFWVQAARWVRASSYWSMESRIAQ